MSASRRHNPSNQINATCLYHIVGQLLAIVKIQMKKFQTYLHVVIRFRFNGTI